MSKRPKKHTAMINDREVITLGHEYEFWSDLYHRAMTIGIWNSKYTDILVPNGNVGIILNYHRFDLTEEVSN